MKTYLHLFLLFLLAIFVTTGCSKGDKYEKMAKELCQCMEPLAEMSRKAQELTDAGGEEAMKSFMEEMRQTAEDAEACATQLEKKYGEVPVEDEEKAEEALLKYCPEIIEIMEGAE
ncbi:MAG: hypothetical protein GY705_05290 [Bacteroidetes bacterium]|nr:hypothetical protein [Bacteroidota bacterium]